MVDQIILSRFPNLWFCFPIYIYCVLCQTIELIRVTLMTVGKVQDRYALGIIAVIEVIAANDRVL